MHCKSSFLPCPVPGMVQGDFQAPLRCARNDREAGISIAPWLAEAQGVTGFAFVSYSHAKHSAESAASRLSPSTAYAVPLPHGWGRQGCCGKCILFMCYAKHSAELAAPGGFSPFGALRHHLRPGGKRVTRFSGRYHSPTNRVPLPTRKSGGTIKLR